ncbi:unnamed protein product [Gongylonema pulchrum]|uniref:C2H2-type domain-containing protein n=1 Tax=Gongylonema pulchrum TaxID=637853 RepID=A0A183EY23_9BILA|nr:unnamed protein product [Gongylonema pulchrum]
MAARVIGDQLRAPVNNAEATFEKIFCQKCGECTGCGKEFASASGRKNHVLKEHFDWSVVCPLRGCSDIYSTTSEMKQHFQV